MLLLLIIIWFYALYANHHKMFTQCGLTLAMSLMHKGVYLFLHLFRCTFSSFRLSVSHCLSLKCGWGLIVGRTEWGGSVGDAQGPHNTLLPRGPIRYQFTYILKHVRTNLNSLACSTMVTPHWISKSYSMYKTISVMTAPMLLSSQAVFQKKIQYIICKYQLYFNYSRSEEHH